MQPHREGGTLTFSGTRGPPGPLLATALYLCPDHVCFERHVGVA